MPPLSPSCRLCASACRLGGDRILSWALRALLAGCAATLLCAALYGLKIYADIARLGFSYTCLGDTCVWLSDGSAELMWPPERPCWQVYHRPC